MLSRLWQGFRRWSKRIFWTLLVVIVSLLGLRIYDIQNKPDLELWHTFAPHELNADEIDAANWETFLANENAAFEAVKKEVIDPTTHSNSIANLRSRFHALSVVYPPSFQDDWNRSYVKKPEGTIQGIAVLLHGLTDSPYSLRHIARSYVEHGYVVVAIRLPGHGTVPSGLVDVEWQDWLAATRLAVRHGQELAGKDAPLQIVGFSNGGALAVKYTLDSLRDSTLARPTRVTLISPMIGITEFARFAGPASWPALIPRFSKAAWLSISPEFNPFKYNSFPANGAIQSYRLTQALQNQVREMASQAELEQLPPILTFQSAMDFTVSTPQVITGLYNFLPANGSDLVLFDINHNTKVNVLFRPTSYTAISRILPLTSRNFSTHIITNVSEHHAQVLERTQPALSTIQTESKLPYEYPLNVFSLSHVALPFPSNDSLYGQEPADTRYGVNLGTMAMRGEIGVLVVNTDSLSRMSSNPFFDYLLKRIEEHM